MTEMQPEDRIPLEALEAAIKGLQGKARYETAARVAEDRVWARFSAEIADLVRTIEELSTAKRNWEDRELEYLAELTDLRTRAVGDPELSMVACLACGATGKMWNGSQCKTCYGATVVKDTVGTLSADA